MQYANKQSHFMVIPFRFNLRFVYHLHQIIFKTFISSLLIVVEPTEVFLGGQERKVKLLSFMWETSKNYSSLSKNLKILENSHFCKKHLQFFGEILKRFRKFRENFANNILKFKTIL